VKVTKLLLTIVQVPAAAGVTTQVPGRNSKLFGGFAVVEDAATVWVAALLLPTVKKPFSTLPGPVQANGSDNEPPLILLTVTVKLQELVRFAASVTVQFTVVTPNGKEEPLAGVQIGAPRPGQLSLTTGAAQVAVAVVPAVPRKIFAGQVIEGAMLSTTVTVKLAEEVLFAASATVQLTVVVPFGKLDPEAGVQTGAPTPGQLSLTTGAA
jgi:hypothetical protein